MKIQFFFKFKFFINSFWFAFIFCVKKIMNHLFFYGGISSIDPLTISSLQHFYKSGLITDPDPGSIVALDPTHISTVNDLGFAGKNLNVIANTEYLSIGNTKVYSGGPAQTGALRSVPPQTFQGILSFTMVGAFFHNLTGLPIIYFLKLRDQQANLTFLCHFG